MDAVKECVGWPQSWYFIGRSKDFGTQPKAVTLGKKRLLVVRDQGRRIHALSAYCSHMGADLSFGRFDAQKIICPMHGWSYDLFGNCVHAPDCSEFPRFARQKIYPVTEVHGVVAVFDRHEAEFPFPFFDGEDPSSFAAARPLHYHGEAPWFWVAANGFDVRHFRVVHGRHLIEQPMVTQTHPDMLRVQYRFAIEGRSISDRILKKLAGCEANLTFTTWRGNIILAEADFAGKVTSRILSFVTPVSPLHCTVDMIPLQKRFRGVGPLSDLATSVSLILRRCLTKSFFREEAKTLRNLGNTPIVLTPEDAILAQYFRWLKSVLPKENFRGP